MRDWMSTKGDAALPRLARSHFTALPASDRRVLRRPRPRASRHSKSPKPGRTARPAESTTRICRAGHDAWGRGRGDRAPRWWFRRLDRRRGEPASRTGAGRKANVRGQGAGLARFDDRSSARPVRAARWSSRSALDADCCSAQLRRTIVALGGVPGLLRRADQTLASTGTVVNRDRRTTGRFVARWPASRCGRYPRPHG